jgi:hypothetical protein
MTGFLLTWKETGWPYENIVRMVREIEVQGYVEEPWRLAAHRTARPGDRVWLFKQGRGPKGIFGAGQIAGEPARGEAGNGKVQWMAPVRFTSFVDPKKELLIDEETAASVLKPNQLKAQASGYPVDDAQANMLDQILASTPVIVLGGSGNWSPPEIDAIIADYFSMLDDELSGRKYSKTDHRNALREIVTRSPGSIERKHQNISAVLNELGLPWISGYKPYANYQDALVEAVEHRLQQNIERIDQTPTAPAPATIDFANIFVSPPKPDKRTKPSKAAARIARKFDPARLDAANRKLGLAGEEFVVRIERERLLLAGKAELAQKVTWVSYYQGDGLGYDIVSFTEAGAEIHIEVKTTKGSIGTPFFISENERRVAASEGGMFQVYRVFGYGTNPQIYIIAGPLETALNLEPINYRASVASEEG